jgi:hypothetical protein
MALTSADKAIRNCWCKRRGSAPETGCVYIACINPKQKKGQQNMLAFFVA